jgi:hypothetical protein
MATPVTNAAADEECPLGKESVTGERRSFRSDRRFSMSGRTRPKTRLRTTFTSALETAIEPRPRIAPRRR